MTLTAPNASNVFFISGRNLEDYVKNPGLNYIAANGPVNLNLDNAVAQTVFVAPGTGSHVSETFVVIVGLTAEWN